MFKRLFLSMLVPSKCMKCSWSLHKSIFMALCGLILLVSLQARVSGAFSSHLHGSPSIFLTSKRRGIDLWRVRGGEGVFSTADRISLERMGLSDGPLVPPALLQSNASSYYGADVSGSVKLRDLYIALTANIGGAGRREAEGLVSRWEKVAAPGFIAALVRIMVEPTADPQVRLLASVVCKNVIGGSRERHSNTDNWTKLPVEEKDRLRKEIMSLLFLPDAPKPLLTQLTLMLSYTAGHDYPRHWPKAIEEIITRGTQAAEEAQRSGQYSYAIAAEMKARTMRAVKHACRAQVPGGEGGSGRLESSVVRMMREIIDPEFGSFFGADQQKPSMLKVIETILTEWRGALSIVLSKGGGAGDPEQAIAAGNLATKCLTALRATLEMREARPLIDPMHTMLHKYIEVSLELLVQIQTALPTFVPNLGDDQQLIAVKMYERILSMYVYLLETNPVEVAPYFEKILETIIEALFRDTTDIYGMRWKHRTLLVRVFLSIICSRAFSPAIVMAYTHRHRRAEETIEKQASDLDDGIDQDSLKSAKQDVERIGQAANLRRIGWAAIGAIVGVDDTSDAPTILVRIIQGTISKLIAVTPEELQSWVHEPEKYLEGAGREDAPPAGGETPRGLGHDIIRALLIRSPRATAQAILQATSSLQHAPTSEPPSEILYIEGAMRVISDICSEDDPIALSISQMYTQTLRPFLVAPEPNVGESQQSDKTDAKTLEQALPVRILKARAALVIGACADRLDIDQWIDAYKLLSELIGNGDPVVSLSGVNGLAMMSRRLQLSKQQEIDSREEYDTRIKEEAVASIMSQSDPNQQLSAAAEAARSLSETKREQSQSLLQRKQNAVAEIADQTLSKCFSVLSGLEEPYSISSVLGLVAQQIELLGPQVDQHIGIFAQAIPKAWMAARWRAETAPPNSSLASIGLTRMYEALMALLTNLTSRLGSRALESEELRSVLTSLLGHVLTVSKDEDRDMEHLRDNALMLFEAVQLAAGPSASDLLSPLIPAVVQILNVNYPSPALAVLDGFFIHDRASLVQEHLISRILPVINETVTSMRDSLVYPTQQGGMESDEARGISTSSIRDIIAISSFVSNILRVIQEQDNNRVNQKVSLPKELSNILKALAQLLVHLQHVGHRLMGPLNEAVLSCLSLAFSIAPTQQLENLAGVAHDGPGRKLSHIDMQHPSSNLPPSLSPVSPLLDAMINVGMRPGIEEVLGEFFSNPSRPTRMFGGFGKNAAERGRARRHGLFIGLCSLIINGGWNFSGETDLLRRIVKMSFRVVFESSKFKEDVEKAEKFNHYSAFPSAMEQEHGFFPGRIQGIGPRSRGDWMRRQDQRWRFLLGRDPFYRLDSLEWARKAFEQILKKMNWSEEQACHILRLEIRLFQQILRGERPNESVDVPNPMRSGFLDSSSSPIFTFRLPMDTAGGLGGSGPAKLILRTVGSLMGAS